MKIGRIALILAALLVAMSVSAFAVTANNGADALTLGGTKIIEQEEVGGYVMAAENMTAFAVPPNEAQAIFLITMIVLVPLGIFVTGMAGQYKPTPGAGGDGLARSTKRLFCSV